MANLRQIRFSCLCCIAIASAATLQAGVEFDEVTCEQAALERKALAAGKSHSQSPGIAKFRQTAKTVRYPSGEYQLPGYLYLPEGAGPFAAIVWNHGSEKDPKAQPELARFYTQQGYVFFVPIRHGHAGAPGPYVGDLQDELRDKERDSPQIKAKMVGLHELYNLDVAAAVEWLKQHPQVDSRRLVMSGVSYGGIQTLLSAEKGLGIRAFVSFAPAAMSFGNEKLRERLAAAASHAKAPIFVLQAKNDYSIGPTELLAPILAGRGDASGGKLYDAFGSTRQQGHGAFACWSLGVMVWGNDVIQFIDAAMTPAAR